MITLATLAGASFVLVRVMAETAPNARVVTDDP
jgi:hypothetical protein